MEKEVVRSYYVQHESELEDVCLMNDPGYQEREMELKAAVEELETLLKGFGHEAWQKLDRVLTAQNCCEAYALREMYIKGVQDAFTVFDGKKEEKDARD